jgi:hypothetical protein
MPTKIITLDDHFATGEPTVQLVSTWGRNGKLLKEATSLHKIAATASPALDYISSVTPEPGKSIVLVVGLGGSEAYGANRNGDAFPAEPVRGKIASDEVLTKHYKSYENAHVFEHHVNKDPTKAIGRVKKAFWNPRMQRVELIEDFIHAKAPHLLEKIAAGEHPAKSMGCGIKYDVCSNCGNRAKTRGEYCDHLKFAMSRIDPESGIQNAALNPSPNFFDSSWVIRPADRTGYMLKKVAKDNIPEIYLNSYDLGEKATILAEKAAALAKAADIEKILQGEPVAAVSSLDKGDASLIKKYMDECGCDAEAPHNGGAVTIMISYKPSEALGTAGAAELPLGVKELVSYFMKKLAPELGGEDVPETILKSANDHLGLVYSIYAAYPRFYDDVIKEAGLYAPPTVNEQLLKKLANSPVPNYIARQVLPPGMQTQRANTDVMNWTDPNTGQRYQTNYGTVQKTHDALIEEGLRQKALTSGALMGGGALLGGAAYGLRPFKNSRPMRTATGLVGAGLGALGVKKLFDPTPIAGPKIMTDEGETISGWTEMVPQTKLGFEYVRTRANEHPRRLSAKLAESLFAQLKHAEIQDDLSPFLGPTLDFNEAARLLGDSIYRNAK